jgi:exodeoxyribonuclease V beta subunit
LKTRVPVKIKGLTVEGPGGMTSRDHGASPLDVFHVPLEGAALVEASAGTGKTWAICGLVLRLLVEKGFSVDQVLALTFTHAATAELRERIRARLLETLDHLESRVDDPFIEAFLARGLETSWIRARLKAASSAFDEASIFTIHGFCQRALGESPFAAAQAFTLELTPGDEVLREVVADYWRRHVTHGALWPALLSWLVTEKGLKPTQLEGLLRRALQNPLAQTLWPASTRESAPSDLAALERAYAELADLWQRQRNEVAAILREKRPSLNQRSFKEAQLDESIRDWGIYLEGGNPLGPFSPNARKLRASTLLKLTTKGHAPPRHDFFEQAETLCALREAQESAMEEKRLALLRHFLEWAADQVERRKRERRQVDFNDLLVRLHDALTGPRGDALAADLRQRYPAVLIDEFQDTDPLQFAIFQRIYAGKAHPVFWVGDPKQAIYSFRQADLHTYLAAKAHVAARYRLDANQRSSAGVIAGVNALFSANPQAFMLPGLDFTAACRGEKPLPPLRDARPGTGDDSRAALRLWQLPEGLAKAKAQQRAAQATAEEIARLVTAARRGQMRVGDEALNPGRIAVLTRTHKQGWLMKAALAAVGLKAAELTQANVFGSIEAEDLERLLAALLEPARVPYVKAALATSLLGENATSIAALREDTAALEAWLERFDRWGRVWRKQGVLAALGEASREQHCAARLLELPDGERRLTNHLHLRELLHQAETQRPQPARLLRWYVEKRQERHADETAQLRLESDQDLVNIVTIHKAKGLEYDMVFCPFFWEGYSAPRQRENLPGQLYHDDAGYMLLDYRPESEAAGKAAARLERAAEWLRLYYVALTRPVHRCYLVWGAYDKPVKNGVSRTESARSLLNWLVAGAAYRPEEWLTAEGKDLPDANALQTAWQALAREAGACAEPLPEAGRHRLEAAENVPRYEAAVARRVLYAHWRVDSFSGLLKRKADSIDSSAEPPETEGGARDEPHDDPHDAAWPPPAAVAPDDILRFPRGPRAGDCIHDLFEHVDFTRPEYWQAAIVGALERHPPGNPAHQAGQAHQAHYPAMLAGLLENVTTTPLPLSADAPPLCLNTLSPAQRLMELEFHLPAARLEAHGLYQLMRAHDEPLPRLDFPCLQGFLKGYVDMVLLHAGRYYVLDWKSNYLGGAPESYHDKAMQQAMREHGYALQARLYLLALHRYLKLRLSAYDPARHLGGACYLFARGARPDWRQPDGKPAGVCLLAPKVELLLAMEAQIAG